MKHLPKYTDYPIEIKELPEPDEIELKPFPYKDTPEVLANWIRDNAEIKAMPPDYIGTGALVTLASLIAGKVKIQPIKTDSTYLEVPNLWGCIVGRPSAMKTPALNLSLEFIKEFERELDLQYQEEYKRFKLKETIIKVEQKELEKDLAKKVRDKKGAMNQEYLVDEFEGRVEEPEEPQAERLVVNDVTPEKLAEICSYSPNGILTVRDELVGLLNDLNRPDRPNAKALYLEGWNGSNSFKTDRIGRGSQSIERLLLNVLGTTQPGVLNKHIREARGMEGGDGLLQRFQLMVYPKLSKEMGVNRQPDLDLKEKVRDIFRKFFEYKVNVFDQITFDQDGQDWFNMFKDENFKLTRSGKLNPILEAHFGKYTKLYCALAFIFTLIEDMDAQEINGDASYKALVWVKYLESHARNIYGLVDDPYWNAQKLLEKFKDLFDWELMPAENQYTTVREVHRKHWKYLSQNEDVSRALDQLVEFGFMLKVKVESNGRPTDRYYPHPDLKSHFLV
tara:strand:- start:459 stop:1976 length:1518 start_codon:yes stop_codon:yes gene_type:complete